MRKMLNTLFVLTPESYLSLEGETVVVNQKGTEAARFPLHTLEGILTFAYAGASPALMGACAERGIDLAFFTPNGRFLARTVGEERGNVLGILTFAYAGASPALMGACAERGIDLAFFTPNGRFLARTVGEERGNVLLRQQQYRIADDPAVSCRYACGFILGKVYNARWVLERATRDHPQRVPVERLKEISSQLAASLMCRYACGFILGKVYNARWVLERATRDHPQRVPVERLKEISSQLAASLMRIRECGTLEELRGLEGEAAQRYFDGFDSLILQQRTDFAFTGRSRRPPLDPINAVLSFAYTLLARECAAALQSVGLDPLQQRTDFAFTGRSRRPPLDPINAVLSFAYTLLARECAAALQSVGLDPYVGFLHRPRPGRTSLALDLIEELRPVCADRFVLSCVNQKIVTGKHCQRQDSGAVWLTDEGRKVFLSAWQKRKQETITHPFLGEKLPWGLGKHCQRQDSGAVWLTDEGRKVFLSAWQKRKQETITHPFLGEKLPWGLVPYVQALLLARTLRGDLEEYPPFFWK